MSIKISEHILSLDENILAVGFYSKEFRMLETAMREGFEKRFRVTPQTVASAPAYKAAIYAMSRMFEGILGSVEKVVVDYAEAKLVIMALKDDRGYVGLVLNSAVNADYLALKLKVIMEVENNHHVDVPI